MRSSSGHSSRPTSFQTKYPQKAAGPSVSSSLANTSSSVSALLVGDAAASPLFASFVFTVEAVKMPPIAVQDSVGVVIGYQLEWSIYYPFSPSPLITTSTAPSTPANAALAAAPPQPIAAGVSPLVFADGDEVHFDYVSPTVSVPLPQHLPTAQQAAAMVRPHRQQQPFRSSSGGSTSSEPVQYPANAFPQLVVNLTARMLDEDSINAAMANSNGYADDNRSSSLLVDTASYSVGTLTLDLASHLPPHGTLQLLQLRNEANNQSHHHTVNMNALKPLKQRATLYLEQCIYQSPPVMIRVLIEGTVLNEKGLYEAEYKGAMLMAGDGMGRGGGVAAVDVGAAENAKLLGKGSQQQQQQRSPSMVSSAPSVSRPIGRVPTPTGRPAMGMLASPFGTSSASTTQHTQEGPHINDDNTNTNNVSASQAIQNGVEMARRRAAQVRAKAREEAERERAEQIKAGGRSGGAPTPAVASTMSSRAHTPIHTSVSLRGSNALNTAPFAAAAANATTARRVVPTNANGTVPPPSSSLPSSSSAPPPPTAPSLYAAPAMRSDTNNNNRGPSQQQQNNANNMTPSRGNISSSPLSHYHATSPQPIPLNGAADGGGSPQPQQHQWGSSSAVAIASPQPSDPTSFKSGAFGSAHHHMANAATASPPRHQQQQVGGGGGGVGGNATLVDVRSPSLSSDIMRALQRSNAMLKEDNERLKQALEQQLSLPQHHHHQRTQMNSILLNDNTTTASALPHDASSLSLFMSPLPHANRNQQQRQHAQQSSEQSMAIVDTIEELASAKAALAHTEGMYAEAVKASREKDHQIEVLQRAKHEAAETEAHLREEVARLETALDVATQAVTRNAAEEKSAVAQLKEQLLDAERTNRDTHHKLRHSEKGLADAKSMLKALEEEVNKEAKARAQAEERAVKVLADCTEKVERYEASLRLGQHELERLHAYGEDLNTRCTELASLVTSQAAMLERRKEKILELRGIIAANEKHLPVGWGTANAAGDLTSSDLVGDAMLGFGAAKNNNNTNKMSSLSANAIQPTNSSVAAAVAPTATNFYTTGNGAGFFIGGPSGVGGDSSSSVAANANTAMNAVAQANAALQVSMARQALTHQRHLMELGAGSPLRELSRMLASQQQQQRRTLHTAPIHSTMNNDSSSHMLMGGAVTPQQQQFGKSNGGGGGGGGGTVLFTRGGNTNTTADNDDFTVSRLRPNERASHHYADPNQAVNDASYLEKSPLQIREEGGAPSSLPPPPPPPQQQQHVPAAFNYQQPYAKEGQFIGIQMVPASLAASPLPLPAAVTIPTSVPRSQQRHESSRSQTQVPSPPASSSPYRSSQRRGGAEQSPSSSTAADAHFYSNASRSPPRPTAMPGPHHHQHIAMVGNNKAAMKRFVPVDDPDL